MAPSWEPRSGADTAGTAAAAPAGGDGADAGKAAGGDGAAAGPLAGAGARASSAANAGASTLRAKLDCMHHPMAAPCACLWYDPSPACFQQLTRSAQHATCHVRGYQWVWGLVGYQWIHVLVRSCRRSLSSCLGAAP